MQFNVHLKDKSHPKLIANQNIEIQIISNQKDSVLRIKKHPMFEDGQRHFVFVVENDVAVKREIVLGISGNDSCEIISGLNEGAEVIVEGISMYRNLNEIKIRN